MHKKILITMIVVLLSIGLIGCQNQSTNKETTTSQTTTSETTEEHTTNNPIGMLEFPVERPNFTFDESRNLTKEEVSEFFDSYLIKMNETIQICQSKKYTDLSEMTVEEAGEFGKDLCGVTRLYKNSGPMVSEILNIKDIIVDTTFYVYDSIQSSTEVEFGSGMIQIDYSDFSLKFMSYNKEHQNFDVYTFAIIDDELYYEDNSYNFTEYGGVETIAYRSISFYENHYYIYDQLAHSEHRVYYKENLETFEFYGYSKTVGSPSVGFIYGDNQSINQIYQMEDDVIIEHIIYEDGLFVMKYSKEIGSDNPQLFIFSALELNNWDNIKGGGDTFYMYDGDEIVNSSYCIQNQVEETLGFFPAIVIDDFYLSSDTLNVNGLILDLSVLKTEIEYLELNYQNKLDEYHVDAQINSLDDFINDFQYIHDYIEYVLPDFFDEYI